MPVVVTDDKNKEARTIFMAGFLAGALFFWIMAKL